MQPTVTQGKKPKLCEFLDDLAEIQYKLNKDKDIDSFCQKLEDIFVASERENFHWIYSEIFSTLSMIDKGKKIEDLPNSNLATGAPTTEGSAIEDPTTKDPVTEDSVTGDPTIEGSVTEDPTSEDIVAEDFDTDRLAILSENITSIKNRLEREDRDEKENVDDTRIKNEMLQYCNYVHIEIARIVYTKTLLHKIEIGNTKIKAMIESLEKQASDINANAKKDIREIVGQFQEKFTTWQRESVTILGIFAAIVMTFIGGMAFSNSVLGNIDKPSIYRILIIAFMLGLILFDTIWILLSFIRSMIDDNIESAQKPIFGSPYILIAIIIGAVVNVVLIGGVIYILFNIDWTIM